ncbi:MAG: helix-turn-helix domain-containing protein [Clostridia bacterium]|nr:helix-turn-helix domain-containing protein [Clostridia bacterium]
MSMSEKIRIALIKKGMSLTEFSEKIDSSPQNLSAKLRRDNFSEKEIALMAEAIDCDYQIILTDRKTGEQY